MTTIEARWRTVAGAFTERTEAVRDGSWENPSPCAGWTARDVVGHLVEWIPPFLAAGSDIRIATGPAVETDPAAAWLHLSDAVESELRRPDIHERLFDHQHAGRHPLDEAIDRFVLGDVLIHTWDLARATGQDDRLDPEVVQGMLIGLEPMADVLAESGQYGPRMDVPVDADPQTRLLALTGRHRS